MGIVHDVAQKNALYLSVNVFSTKIVLIRDTIFTSPTIGGTAIFSWSPEPREGVAAFNVKGIPSFLSYFKTLGIGPAPRISRDLPLCIYMLHRLS